MSSSDRIRVQRIEVFQIKEIKREKIQLLTGHLCEISEPWYEGLGDTSQHSHNFWQFIAFI